MAQAYVYDYCTGKHTTVNNYKGGLYHSAFELRKETRAHNAKLTNSKTICKSCRHRATKQCPKISLVPSGVDTGRTRRGGDFNEVENATVRFRSDRKRGKGRS